MFDRDLEPKSWWTLGRPVRQLTGADLDGDGIYEVIHRSDDPDTVTTVVRDARSGEVRMNLPGARPRVLDMDGDGYAEILTVTDELDIIAWNAAEGEWAPAQAYHQDYNQTNFYPTRFYPDGSHRPPDEHWVKPLVNVAWNDSAQRGIGAELTLRIGDTCEAVCEQDDVAHVWVHPGNAGQVDVERPLVVELIGVDGEAETVLDSRVVTATLPAGQELDALELVATEVSTWERVEARIRTEDWVWQGCNDRPDAVVLEGLCEG